MSVPPDNPSVFSPFTIGNLTLRNRTVRSGCFEGMSQGGTFGAIIPAVEDRIKASVLIAGSIQGLGRPEIQEINFLGRVKIPTLMLNGRYDTIEPLEQAIRPMFDLLGTPAADKRLILYETDHIPPVNEMIKETLAWLDKYLGPVKR